MSALQGSTSLRRGGPVAPRGFLSRKIAAQLNKPRKPARRDPLWPSHIFLTADAVGGVWTWALELARGLSAQGKRVTLAVLGPPPSAAQREDCDAIFDLDLLVTGLALDWTAVTARDVLTAADEIERLARKAGADLTHFHAPALASDRPARPTVASMHSCVATWQRTARNDPLPADLAWRADLTRRGLRLVDRVSTPSHAFAAEVERCYGRSNPIIAVRNGCAPPPASKRGVERRLILASGRLWDEGKNIATLDRAAALTDGEILAAGSTTGPNGETRTFSNLRLLGDLTRAEMVARLAETAVYVSPSVYEPFGLGVLEAAQSGAALVLADIPTFRELWDGAALFVPPRDADALARAIDVLANDRPLRRDLAARAEHRARRYTVDRMVADTLDLYRHAAGDRRGAPAGAEAAP